MHPDDQDPRDIPVLTDVVETDGKTRLPFDVEAAHAAILTQTLELADSLVHQAAKDIEAALFERVLDRLRAELPGLVDRVLREHALAAGDTEHAVPL